MNVTKKVLKSLLISTLCVSGIVGCSKSKSSSPLNIAEQKAYNEDFKIKANKVVERLKANLIDFSEERAIPTTNDELIESLSNSPLDILIKPLNFMGYFAGNLSNKILPDTAAYANFYSRNSTTLTLFIGAQRNSGELHSELIDIFKTSNAEINQTKSYFLTDDKIKYLDEEGQRVRNELDSIYQNNNEQIQRLKKYTSDPQAYSVSNDLKQDAITFITFFKDQIVDLTNDASNFKVNIKLTEEGKAKIKEIQKTYANEPEA